MQSIMKRSNRSAQSVYARREKARAIRCLSEALEPRTLLSGMTASTASGLALLQSKALIAMAKTHFSTPTLALEATPSANIGSATPVGLIPAQIRGAYGLGQVGASNVTFGAIQGDGSGQTIAIVDAYDDPNALSDLQHFDAQFGLPDPPSFTKLNQNGATSPLPTTDPEGPFVTTGILSWEVEESLDIEWAHVMAPQAKIDLVECNSPNDNDLIISGVLAAANQPGVSVVSMSFGGGELEEENLFDQLFFTPAGHNGVTFVASTGDSGSPSGFPAYSPDVLAVGGTSLTVSGNNYVGETAWGGSGGGISLGEFQSSYQTPFFNSPDRSAPDVSMVADPGTGVAIYDSFDFTSATPWVRIGGTSLAAPLWGGMMAVVNQGRVINGLSTLDGGQQTLPLIYGLPSTDFHDILSGSNGQYSAQAGYDLVTGRGSPIANLVIPALASAAAPTVKTDLQPFQAFDSPSNALWSAPIVLSTQTAVHTDPTMIVPGNPIFFNASWYNDSATNTAASFLTDFQITTSTGTTDLGAPVTNGGLLSTNFEFITDVQIGTFGSGFTTISMNVDSTNLVPESTETNNTFSRTYAVDSTANDNYVVMLDPTGTTVEVFLNNALAFSMAKNALSTLSFYLSGANDSVTVDSTNGNPIPFMGLLANGSAANDTLSITGSAGNDTVELGSGAAIVNEVQFTFAGMSSVSVNGAGGNDLLTLDGTNSANSISVSTSQVNLNGLPVNFSNTENLKIDTGAGNDVLTQLASPNTTLSFALGTGSDIFNLNGGTIAFANDASAGTSSLTMNMAAGTSATFNATQHFSALNINGGSAAFSVNGSRVLIVGTLAVSSGSLDISDNAIIATSTSLATITNLLQTGFSGGAWNGTGINSSTAATHAGQTIGFGPASTVFTTFPATFSGQTVSSGTAILVRYTILGDANLDRTVNVSDFNILAAHYNGGNLPSTQGNFNFDTSVNAGDFDALARKYGLSSTGDVALNAVVGPDGVGAPSTPNLFSSIIIRDDEGATLLG